MRQDRAPPPPALGGTLTWPDQSVLPRFPHAASRAFALPPCPARPRPRPQQAPPTTPRGVPTAPLGAGRRRPAHRLLDCSFLVPFPLFLSLRVPPCPSFPPSLAFSLPFLFSITQLFFHSFLHLTIMCAPNTKQNKKQLNVCQKLLTGDKAEKTKFLCPSAYIVEEEDNK